MKGRRTEVGRKEKERRKRGRNIGRKGDLRGEEEGLHRGRK